MLEKHDVADLLATARDVVLSNLLSAIPPGKALQTGMVAAAITLAIRERAANTLAIPSIGIATLAREIRAGTHDPDTPTHEPTLTLLRAQVRLCADVSARTGLG